MWTQRLQVPNDGLGSDPILGISCKELFHILWLSYKYLGNGACARRHILDAAPGVFTCKAFYDRGAVVHLRGIGCLASVKTSVALDWSRPLPAGMVVQARRSAHEYILDAASTPQRKI